MVAFSVTKVLLALETMTLALVAWASFLGLYDLFCPGLQTLLALC